VNLRALGILEVIVSGICFGFLGYFGHLAYGQGISPGELLSLRFLISATVLFAVFALRYLATREWGLRLSRREILDCLGLGIFGYAVFSSCFFFALQFISASLTVLLLYLYPCFVAVAAHSFLGERLGLRDVYALVLSTLGLVFVVGSEFHVTSGVGIALGLGSAVVYAAYILYSRRALRKTSAWASVFYIQLGAGLVLTLLNFRTPERLVEIVAQSWPLLLLMAIVATLIAMALFLSALGKLTSTEVSILSNTEPLTGLVVAALLLGERLSPLQYLGGALVLAGLCLLALKKKPVLDPGDSV